MVNNYYNIVDAILTTAKKHKLINDTYYGDIYEYHNSGVRKYSTFVLTSVNTVESENITTYNFNAFVTDRLTDDKSNLIEVQSISKTILSQILKECFDNIGDITYTFWTEKFNDLCAGCYASFSVSVPNEFICADESIWRDKKIPYAIIFTVANPPSSYRPKAILALRTLTANEKVPSGWPLSVAKGFYEQNQYSTLDFAASQGHTEEYYNRELSETSINQFMQVAQECGIEQYVQILYKK